MSEEKIIQPKDITLVFECEECGNQEGEMASVSIYNGNHTCPKCDDFMDFSHAVVKINK